MSAAGVPVPRFQVRRLDEDPRAAAQVADYPCVLKPLCLSASRGVIRADSPEAFVAAHRTLSGILRDPEVVVRGEESRRYLVESFVPGPEFAL